MRAHDQRKIDELLSTLEQAEHSGDAEAMQRAYEGLFSLCLKNKLDLDAVLRKPRTATSSSLISALKALWPTS